jgi:Ca-activated chloride channel family protein
VLITDGAANLGDADPESLKQRIIKLRQQGIAFDACGVGADGLNDATLEALTRKGDGRYYFLDRPEDADESFVRQLAGSLRPAAKNVKVQVKFNPERVARYRLLGFEKHRLAKEDFRNDKVDAAEMAAAESGNALYQFEADPQGSGDVGEVFVRFLDTSTKQMVERSWPIPYQPKAPRLADAKPSMQLAATAGLLAEKLKGGAQADVILLDELIPITNQLRSNQDPRVDQLIQMVEKTRSLSQ